MVTTAVQEERPPSFREEVLRLAKTVEPFNYERYKATHDPGFESEEEMEAFIADIYADRERNPA